MATFRTEKYFTLKPKGRETHLRIQVYYDLGGYGFATYRQRERGYYLAVTPVVKGNNWIESGAFRGVSCLLKEVSRQSKKGEKEALLLAQGKLAEVVNYVCKMDDVELAERQVLTL